MNPDEYDNQQFEMTETQNKSGWWTLPARENIPLWRYMDLSKFLSLLQNSAIHFARADKLGDPFEGSVGPENVDGERFLSTQTAEQIVQLREQILEEKWADGQYENLSDDLRFKARLQDLLNLSRSNRQAMPKEVYVSCWHMNDHESAAMF